MVVNEARRWFVAESGMLAAVVFFWWSRGRLTDDRMEMVCEFWKWVWIWYSLCRQNVG